MKESMFNEYFSAADGKKLAFNSYSCGLAVVDEQYERLIKDISKISKDNVPDDLRECFDAACEGMFIVEDDFDELANLYIKRNFQKYSVESLGLTIAPTLACNFKCIYCYETSKPGMMSKEVQDKLVEFVQFESDHLKNLSISWYGGEPLLDKELIYSLSERFISICNEKGIEYGAFIISNGSLIDDDIILNLIKYKVRGIQITVDGPPEIHDSRRVSKNGVGTFDVLLENINKLLKTEEIEVVLRINVDKSNDEDVERLIDILSSRLVCKNVKITFGQVTAYTEACKTIEHECYDNGEFAIKLLHYYKLLEKYGFHEFNEFPYPEVKLNYCCAELMNSFVVDPEGFLYKCWNEVGNTCGAIGNITDNSFDVTNYKNGIWVRRDPFSDIKCASCSLLPVCMGGCPHNDMVLKKEHVCDLIKYNIQDIMLKYYEMYK